MREQWAFRLAMLTGVAVVALTALMALRFDAQAGDAAPVEGKPEVAAADPAQLKRGAEVYESEGCAGCHSIAGQGNPRHPLDGVGARLDAEQLHQWTVAAPEVAERLPRRTAMMKQGYTDLDDEDLEALVAYLGSLRP